MIKLLTDFHKNQHRCISCSKLYAEQHREQKKIYDEKYYINVLKNRRRKIKNRLATVVNGAKYRALKYEMDFEIDANYLFDMLQKQNFKCSQTQIEFDFSISDGNERLLKTISLDRKDSSKGYTKENIQIVCLFYNLAKNNSSDLEIWNLMKQAVKNKGE